MQYMHFVIVSGPANESKRRGREKAGKEKKRDTSWIRLQLGLHFNYLYVFSAAECGHARVFHDKKNG